MPAGSRRSSPATRRPASWSSASPRRTRPSTCRRRRPASGSLQRRSPRSPVGSSRGPRTTSTGPSSLPWNGRCRRSRNPDWRRDGIDRWILARLEQEGLSPAEEADPYVLLRRVSLDLRGLPPTPEEIEQFVRDTEPGAYERAVDRFLDDPAFGERWARIWLDLARYADSRRLRLRPAAPTIWRYRDWVIDAFNRNMPYDQFTIEQIAGDLLPEPTLEQKIATAFHRNTMTNTEGGTDDEEFRVAAIKDRVDTTMQVWMGLTMGLRQVPQPQVRPDHARPSTTSSTPSSIRPPTTTSPTSRPPCLPPPVSSRRGSRRSRAGSPTLRTILDTPTPELAGAQANWEAELSEKVEWPPLEITAAHSEGGATLEVHPDGSIRVTGTAPDQDTYTVNSRTDQSGITAFRLEAIPDPALPKGGAGRAPDGNFVLSHLAVEAAPVSEEAEAPVGQFVRIELPGDGKILSLAEVQVFRNGENIATKARPPSPALTTKVPPNEPSTATPTATTSTRSPPPTLAPSRTPGGRFDSTRQGRSSGSPSGTAPTAGPVTVCRVSGPRFSTSHAT